jgi:hypothetical protein
MAFGRRFDVTGLIPADQYGQCSSPYYDKGSYYKQEDFYYSTDESNEDTNSNSEQVLSESSTKAFLWSSKLR